MALAVGGSGAGLPRTRDRRLLVGAPRPHRQARGLHRRFRPVGLVHRVGTPRDEPRAQPVLQRRDVRTDGRQPGSEHGEPVPRISDLPDLATREPLGECQSAHGAGHAGVGYRRLPRPSALERLGPCGRPRRCDLRILSLHGEPGSRPRRTRFHPGPTVHRPHDRGDTPPPGQSPLARHPAGSTRRGAVPHLARGDGRCRHLVDRRPGVHCGPQPRRVADDGAPTPWSR